jgi:hypothetical protein
MNYSDYDLNKIRNADKLRDLIQSAFYADGCITDYNSEIFKKNAELYRELFNELASEVLIVKLKICESEAKLIHKKVWKQLDFINYPINEKCFISEYIRLLIDIANAKIKEAEEVRKNNGSRLSELFSKSIANNHNADVNEYYTEQCHFVWDYINDMNSKEKKIFLYKLYGELSFEEISIIMNIDKKDIISIYNKAENRLFSDEKFRKFFK